MHATPPRITDNIIKICNSIRGYNLQYVDVLPCETAKPYDCHNNCDDSIFKRVTGYYIVCDIAKGCYSLVRHSVIKKGDTLIDITPSKFSKILFVQTDVLYYKYYTNIGEYLYMNYTELKNLPETLDNYYIYALINPVDDSIFYIGKGKKNRWMQHMSQNYLKDNTHKSNKINKIHSLGMRVAVKFLEHSIESEYEAYMLEEQYIKQYGRICDGGSLTNVCIDSKPPNHKGKTYDEIYGKNANYQRDKRRKAQISAGGYFGGRKHKESSKEKISIKSKGISNGNSSNLTESDYIEHGEKFCLMFNNKISNSKWKHYCKLNSIPPAQRTFRFNGNNILRVFCDVFGAEVQWEKQYWYNDSVSNIRLSDWYIEMYGEPEGYKRGRV